MAISQGSNVSRYPQTVAAAAAKQQKGWQEKNTNEKQMQRGENKPKKREAKAKVDTLQRRQHSKLKKWSQRTNKGSKRMTNVAAQKAAKPAKANELLSK